MIIFYLITLVVIIFTSVGHLLLKIAANRAREANGRVRMVTHPVSIIAYGIFAFVALLSIYAMKGLEMKSFFALNSLTYIVIPLLGLLVLKEPFSRDKITGAVLITAGVLLFYL